MFSFRCCSMAQSLLSAASNWSINWRWNWIVSPSEHSCDCLHALRSFFIFATGTKEETKLIKLHVCNQNTFFFYRRNKSKQMKSRVGNKRAWFGLVNEAKNNTCVKLVNKATTRNLKSLFMNLVPEESLCCRRRRRYHSPSPMSKTLQNNKNDLLTH